MSFYCTSSSSIRNKTLWSESMVLLNEILLSRTYFSGLKCFLLFIFRGGEWTYGSNNVGYLTTQTRFLFCDVYAMVEGYLSSRVFPLVSLLTSRLIFVGNGRFTVDSLRYGDTMTTPTEVETWGLYSSYLSILSFDNDLMLHLPRGISTHCPARPRSSEFIDEWQTKWRMR